MSYAVIGRVEYDDEDTCMIFEGVSPAFAKQSFEQHVRHVRDLDPDRIVYVNYVLESSAQITISENTTGVW